MAPIPKAESVEVLQEVLSLGSTTVKAVFAQAEAMWAEHIWPGLGGKLEHCSFRLILILSCFLCTMCTQVLGLLSL